MLQDINKQIKMHYSFINNNFFVPNIEILILILLLIAVNGNIKTKKIVLNNYAFFKFISVKLYTL